MAKHRLNEIHTDFSHDQFRSMDKGKYCKFCTMFGENLARGQKDIFEVYTQWLESESHRKVLKTAWKYTCVQKDYFKGKHYYVFIGAK